MPAPLVSAHTGSPLEDGRPEVRSRHSTGAAGAGLRSAVEVAEIGTRGKAHVDGASLSSRRRSAVSSRWASCSSTIAGITSRSIRKVLVCDQIAESDDLPPRDRGSKGPSVVGDLCRRLADDDEVVENGIAGLSVE